MTTLPGFSVADFDSCTPKALCGCGSDNLGYVYNSENPCISSLVYDFNSSDCTCIANRCRKYYLEVYMSDQYCNTSAGTGSVVLSNTSTTFFQATRPSIGPANSLKCTGGSVPKGAQGTFSVLIDCNGNHLVNNTSPLNALALSQGNRQYAGHRVWEVDDGGGGYDNPVLVDSVERDAATSPLPAPAQPGLPVI